MKNLVALLFAPILLTQPVAAQDNWVVNPDQANCLFQNLSDYQNSADEPIVIFLDVCPTVDRMEALRKMQKNSSTLPGPRVYVLADGSQKEADKVIVYTKAELECLRNLEDEIVGSPMLLPQKPCTP